LALTTVVAILLIALIGVTQTNRFRNFLRAQVLSGLQRAYQGEITLRHIEGSIWGSLTIRDLSISYAQREVLYVPTTSLHYSLISLLHGSVNFSAIVLTRPVLVLNRANSGGAWNLIAAMTPREPSTKSSGYTLVLQHIEIKDAAIALQTSRGVEYRLTNIVLSGSGRLAPNGLRFEVRNFSSVLNEPKLPQLWIRTNFAVDTMTPGGQANISELQVYTKTSRIRFRASIHDLSKINTDAFVTIDRIAAQDLNKLYDLGLRDEVSGSARLSGDLMSLSASVILSCGSARIGASVNSQFASRPRYRGTLYVTTLDLKQILTQNASGPIPSGLIGARVNFSGIGSDLKALSANVDVHNDNLELPGLHLGRFDLASKMQHGNVSINATVTENTGHAQLDGNVEISRPLSYDLALATAHVNLGRILGRRELASDLNVQTTIRGSGTNPDELNGDLRIRFSPSSLGTIKVDQGLIHSRISRGMAEIRQLIVKTNDSAIETNGSIALVGSHRTNLRYSIHIASLRPWLATATLKGEGGANVIGSISGDLNSARVNGTGELTNFRYDAYSVKDAKLSYDVTRLARQKQFEGRLNVAANRLNAGIKLKSVEATTQLVPGLDQVANTSLVMVDDESRKDRLIARIAYRPQRFEVSLTALNIATSDGVWNLRSRGDVLIENHEVRVQRLELANGTQTAELEGLVTASGSQDLRGEISQLQLSSIASLVQGPKFEGILSANVRVSGTAAAPIISLSTKLTSPSVENVRFAGFDLDVSFAGDRLNCSALLRQDTAHSLNGTGTIPVRISWARGLVIQPAGDMNVAISSSSIDLAFLSAMSHGSFEDFDGSLAMALRVSGPLTHPTPAGFIQLSNGTALVRALNVRVRQAEVRLDIDPKALKFTEIRALSSDGRLDGSGIVNYEGYKPTHLSIDIALDKWPAIATHQYNFTIAGEVNCRGPLEQLQLTGALKSLGGTARPDIALFEQQSLKPDDTIRVIRSWDEGLQGQNQAQVAQSKMPANKAASAFDAMRIALTFAIDRDNWVKLQDSSAELQGHIQVIKPTGHPISLSGEIHTVRGTIGIAGKQLDVTRGTIDFTDGNKVDPGLNIVSTNQVQNYQVTAAVEGTASKPTLSLSSVPSLDQADILSLLMFGRTVNKLDGSQQQNLQRQALGLAGSYAASQVGQSVARALGISSLGISAGEGGVGIGHYLTKNVYLSASQGSTQPNDREGSFTYYVLPELGIKTSTSTLNGNQVELQWHKNY